jgi:hypothetical protein
MSEIEATIKNKSEGWYCLVGDQDGHDYIIPLNKRDEFEMYVADPDGYEGEDYFDDYRIDGGTLCFKEWKQI